MTRTAMAFPAAILLLSLSICAKGQSLVDGPSAPVAPHLPQAQPPSPGQSPVIVVRPDLTDEQMADLYMARKEYREASQLYKRLADQNPQNAVYLNKLGIALHQQTALAQALKYYERAVKVDPTYADAENNIGTIFYQRKKYEQAIAAFRQALAMDPHLFEHNSSRNGSILQDRTVGDRGKFYFLLAKSYAEAGNLERCLIYLRKAKDEGYKQLAAIKMDPSFAAVLKDPAIQEVLAPKPTDSTQP